MKNTELLKKIIDFTETTIGEIDDIDVYNNFNTFYVKGCTAEGERFEVNIRIEKEVKSDD